MKILQKGFNYSQDGPGNRLVYHLQGCNFRCKWCSNADSIPPSNPKSKDITIDDIFNEIMRCRMMFFDGGGVTFTGGEATLQHTELMPLLKRLKDAGVNTCIETNGSVPTLKEIAEFVDYLIIDFKHFDNETHIFWTGHDNIQTKDNIGYFLNRGRFIHIRIPVINKVNVFPEEFAEFFGGFNTRNAVFEFLPYHEFGKDKWHGKYEITDGFVSPEIIERFEKAFTQRGLKTIKT